jgi:hypothetical protein
LPLVAAKINVQQLTACFVETSARPSAAFAVEKATARLEMLQVRQVRQVSEVSEVRDGTDHGGGASTVETIIQFSFQWAVGILSYQFSTFFDSCVLGVKRCEV